MLRIQRTPAFLEIVSTESRVVASGAGVHLPLFVQCECFFKIKACNFLVYKTCPEGVGVDRHGL